MSFFIIREHSSPCCFSEPRSGCAGPLTGHEGVIEPADGEAVEEVIDQAEEL